MKTVELLKRCVIFIIFISFFLTSSFSNDFGLIQGVCTNIIKKLVEKSNDVVILECMLCDSQFEVICQPRNFLLSLLVILVMFCFSFPLYQVLPNHFVSLVKVGLLVIQKKNKSYCGLDCEKIKKRRHMFLTDVTLLFLSQMPTTVVQNCSYE